MTAKPLNVALARVLNEAQAAAIAEMHGVPAIPSELARLAIKVKSRILVQVALGQWAEFGIVDPDDMLGLVVTAKLGRTALGEPPIKIEYDWTRTARPDIWSKSTRPS